MQAQFQDQLRMNHIIGDTARTLFIVAIVCMFMPFFSVSLGEVKETFSLYDIIATFYKSEIGLTFSLRARGVMWSLKAFAFILFALAFFGLAMLFNANKARENSDNSKFTLVAAFLEIPLILAFYYYFRHVIFTEAGADAIISMNSGGICTLICFGIAVPFLLSKFLKKRTVMAALIILVVIPLTITFGITFLNDRSYYIISLLVIIETMIPFFMIFESRKPEARELVLIAVIAAIAVAGRAAFFMLPHFKPMLAIIIIAAVCLGAEAGFLTGALAAFSSNFFFGQGPWTPWQMFSFGIIGFLAGILFKKGLLPKKNLPLCIFGFFAALIIYGLLMDTATIFLSAFKAQQAFWYIYLSGFPVNVVHGIATAFFLAILARPMIEKIDRIKKKYGMMEP